MNLSLSISISSAFCKGRWGTARTSRVNNSAGTDAPSAGPLSYVTGSHLCVALVSLDAAKLRIFFVTTMKTAAFLTIVTTQLPYMLQDHPGSTSRGPSLGGSSKAGSGCGNVEWSGAERRRRVSADARSACGSAAACWRCVGGVGGGFGRLCGGSAGAGGHLKGGSRAFCRHDSATTAGRPQARAGGSAADSPRQPRPDSRRPQAIHLCKPRT